jgi:hypothetical protein
MMRRGLFCGAAGESCEEKPRGEEGWLKEEEKEEEEDAEDEEGEEAEADGHEEVLDENEATNLPMRLQQRWEFLRAMTRQ